jgi:sterol desaturase/sphingolipid hydroxylase (fatty acid hydroxylase superfamily)
LILSRLQDWAGRFLFPWDDPGSRLFGLNLLASVLLVVFFLFSKGERGERLGREIWKTVFSKRYWWNHSTKEDYLLYLLNAGLKLFLVFPFVRLSFWTSTKILGLLSRNFSSPLDIAPGFFALLLFSAAGFAFDDFLRFAHHWLMHKVPVLWRLHQVHHSAHVLTPFTLFRLHPLESAMAVLRNSFSSGVSLGCFLFFFRSADPSVSALAGTAGFGMLFNFLGANFRHSHIALSFGWLENVFISPAQHQLHHARSRNGVNLGVSLAVWDGLFGSLERFRPGAKLRFGLAREINSRKPNSTVDLPVLVPEVS